MNEEVLLTNNQTACLTKERMLSSIKKEAKKMTDEAQNETNIAVLDRDDQTKRDVAAKLKKEHEDQKKQEKAENSKDKEAEKGEDKEFSTNDESTKGPLKLKERKDRAKLEKQVAAAKVASNFLRTNLESKIEKKGSVKSWSEEEIKTAAREFVYTAQQVDQTGIPGERVRDDFWLSIYKDGAPIFRELVDRGITVEEEVLQVAREAKKVTDDQKIPQRPEEQKDLILPPDDPEEIRDEDLRAAALELEEDVARNPLKKWTIDKVKGVYKKINSLARRAVGRGDKRVREATPIQVAYVQKPIAEELSRRAASGELAQDELKKLYDESKISSRPPKREADEAILAIKAEIKNNPDMTDEDRLGFAEKVLGRIITPDEKKAILEAHYFAMGETGKDGKNAGIDTYTIQQNLRKGLLLRRAHLSAEEVEKLMQAGITGQVISDEIENKIHDPQIRKIAGRLDRRMAVDAGSSDIHAQVDDLMDQLTDRDGVLSEEDKEGARQIVKLADEYLRQQREKPLIEAQRRQKQEEEKEERAVLKQARSSHHAEGMINELLARKEGNLRGQLIADGKLNEGDESPAEVKQAIEAERKRLKDIAAETGGKGQRGGLTKDAIEISVKQIKLKMLKERKLQPNDNLKPEDQRELDAITEELYRIQEHEQERRHEDPYALPESIQEVCHVIAQTEGYEKWGFGGKYALTDIIRKEGQLVERFNEGNYRRWVRSRMMQFIKMSPDSPQDLINVVVVGGGGGIKQYGMQTMVLNPQSYFHDKETDRVLDDLSQDIFNELWLRSTAYQNDTRYRAVAGQEGEISKTIAGLYATNDFTKPESLESVFGLNSAVESKKLSDAKNRLEKAKQSGDVKAQMDAQKDIDAESHKLGKAIRAGILTYYYLCDPKMLEKVYGGTGHLPRNFSLFNQTQFYDKFTTISANEKIDSRNSEEQRLGRGKISQGEEDEIRQKFKRDAKRITAGSEKFFDKNGILIDTEENKRAYSEHINIFNQPTKDSDDLTETREKIRFSLMERFGIDYDEAVYAEWYSYAMARWTGAGARNDYAATSHDAWTKVQKMRDYRMRQTSPDRVGVFGNQFDVMAFKSMGLNFYSGIQDKNKRTILELIQGGSGDEVDLDKDLGRIVFGENETRQFYANHIAHDFNLLKYIGEGDEANFDQFTKYDIYGRMDIDHGKANQVFDGFFKSVRYPFATYQNLDWSKKEEYQELEYNKDGTVKNVVGKVGTMLEARFDRVVYDHPEYYLHIDKRFKDRQGRHYTREEFKVLETEIKAAYRDAIVKRLEKQRVQKGETKKPTAKELEELIAAEFKNVARINFKEDKETEEIVRKDKDGNVVRDREGKEIVDKKSIGGTFEGVDIYDEEARKEYGEIQYEYEKDNDGNILLDKKGNPKKIKNKNGTPRVKIDANAVQLDRKHFWKWIALTKIAAEITNHRSANGNGKYYSFEEMERIYSYLSNIPANLVWEEGDMSSVRSGGRGFSKEEINWLRKMTGTGTWNMASQELGFAVKGGGLVGIWKMLMMLAKETVK